MARSLSLVACFSEIEDHRVDRTKKHKLIDIICLAVLAVIAGAEGWEEIEEFGEDKEEWLRKYLELPNGIPSHDTISRVFRALKPDAFQEAFAQWIEVLHDHAGLQLVAVDGKTIRRSHDNSSMKSALHAVCAWSVANHVVLGQESVDQKSNEITAIPELLKRLELKGALVSIDAMGCQKEIAKQIVDAGADYVLAVKDNQPKLHEAIDQHFLSIHNDGLKDSSLRQLCKRDAGHGRIEERYYYVCDLPESMSWAKEEWKGIRSIGEVITIIEREGKRSIETRHFITSREAKVRTFAEAVRGHWGIENSLHWVLDVTFNEDQSRIRKDNGPDNFALLRRFAITIIKQDKSKGSIRRKRKRAAWNDDALATIARLKS